MTVCRGKQLMIDDIGISYPKQNMNSRYWLNYIPMTIHNAMHYKFHFMIFLEDKTPTLYIHSNLHKNWFDRESKVPRST